MLRRLPHSLSRIPQFILVAEEFSKILIIERLIPPKVVRRGRRAAALETAAWLGPVVLHCFFLGLI